MMSDPLVSVLIPAYNCALFIEQAIYSIISQTYKNIEVLVCDDCSTDQTLDVLRRMSTLDTRIKVYHNSTNKGKVLTINKLFNISQGEYISFLDADDYLANDKIQRRVECFIDNPNLGLVGCNYASVSTNGMISQVSNLPLLDHDIRNYIMISRISDFCFCCASVMIPKKVYSVVGGYRHFFIHCCIGEDIDWILRILEKYPVRNIDYVGYFYRFHSNSLTRRVYFSPRDRHMHDIVAFLAKERKEVGVDFVETQNMEEYRRCIAEISLPYIQDKGLLYRKVIIEYSINKNRKMAFMYFRRLLKIERNCLNICKVFFLMLILLYTRNSYLIALKKIFNLSHLSSHI
ncbi:glycosyltransferase family 2 protein [Bacteroides fragilis]|nr:glycosyltransferase family 2 protein [Bacteroides fragilis]